MLLVPKLVRSGETGEVVTGSAEVQYLLHLFLDILLGTEGERVVCLCIFP